jgi:hypothetical protein
VRQALVPARDFVELMFIRQLMSHTEKITDIVISLILCTTQRHAGLHLILALDSVHENFAI